MSKFEGKDVTLDYDPLADAMYIKRKNIEAEYDHTIEVDNIYLDMGITKTGEKLITGVEIIDASETFGLNKFDLSNIVGTSGLIEVYKETVQINIILDVLKRNKHFEKSINAKTLNEYGLSNESFNIQATSAVA
ncbi:conserved hypothetical protein [Methanococcus vannielii SB]|uniref:DUF2283 domain-containing protein n=1 Tax=Methanococcus vannielii (strain ATCC 35089 / DSM 1224 / JCM 13029 / OCM 148 / SB) TaxID=406327 RepID=A6UNE0_METVS|nr:DUF2283 domain-containing protein [Methanococcus vannielii]ABR54012.1 conserved hypothetical protein [Methanococcus vannielii SB]ABR55536.1 conserved hypothetical protein [Methanococcus vannielii SB]